jgi:hypothetical protein
MNTLPAESTTTLPTSSRPAVVPGIFTGSPVAKPDPNYFGRVAFQETLVLYRERPGAQLPMAVPEAGCRVAFDTAV